MIFSKKKTIIIVDAFSGGKYLIGAFKSLGYQCIHIQSDYLPNMYKIDYKNAKKLCDLNIKFDGNLKKLDKILNNYNIIAIISGSEGAINFTDLLNHRYNLKYSNPKESSLNRRDKYQMQEKLKQDKIPHIKQKLVKIKDDIINFLENVNYPIVLKPLSSAGSHNVYICKNNQEMNIAYDKIMGSKDLYGKINKNLLCQEFLEGIEFIVNGVSCDKNYFITDIWKSTKKSILGTPVYDTQLLQYKNDKNYKKLKNYVIQICKSLGIFNGAFHAEVMLTKNGPILIEVGARVAGGADPYIVQECLGHSQISKIVESVLEPRKFILEAKKNKKFKKYKYAIYIYMISFKKGKVFKYPKKNPFKKIKDFVSMNYKYKVGEIQKKTINLLSSPGTILLINKKKKKSNNLVKKVRKIEQLFYSSYIK